MYISYLKSISLFPHLLIGSLLWTVVLFLVDDVCLLFNSVDLASIPLSKGMRSVERDIIDYYEEMWRKAPKEGTTPTASPKPAGNAQQMPSKKEVPPYPGYPVQIVPDTIIFDPGRRYLYFCQREVGNVLSINS